MTHLEFFRCDECEKEMDWQIQFVLVEADDFGSKFHFCSLDCLRKFVNKSPKEWKNKIKPNEQPYGECLGDFHNYMKGNGSYEALRIEKGDEK